MDRDFVVALVSEVFFGDGAPERLAAMLRDARARGAALAILPELPLQHWCPATKEARDDDAEPPGGARATLLAGAARECGIAVLGGAIVRDPATGRRFNTGLLVDAAGELRGSYRKLHLPEEPGFWETSHYEPGDTSPVVTRGVLPLAVGIQLCSDVNRPVGSHLLAAAGAEAILIPRGTEPSTFDPWRLAFRSVALTTTTFVLSANRPRPEGGTPLGGPSIAVAPDGEVLLETLEPVAIVTLRREALDEARRGYPGYLAVRPGLWAEGFAAVRERLS